MQHATESLPALRLDDELMPASGMHDLARHRSARDGSRFRDILDALPAAIYTTDAAGRVTHFNPAAVRLSGRTPELGTDRWCVSWKLFYSDGRPMRHDECLMAIALKEGRAVRGETAILERPDGSRAWFMPYPTPWLDDDGHVVGGINMLVDVTEQIKNEADLRDSQARLASEAEALAGLNALSSRLWRTQTLSAGLDEILAAVVDLLDADFGNVQLLDRDGNALRIAAQRGFGGPFLRCFREVSSTDESICGAALRSMQRVLVENIDTDPQCASLRTSARAAGVCSFQTTPLTGRDDVLLGVLSTHWRRPHLPDEQSLRRLDLYVRQAVDFIERKKAEETLRRNEDRFRTFASATSDVVYRMSPDWTEMRKLQGRECLTDTVTPNRSWMEIYVHPDDRELVLEAIGRSIRSGSVFDLEHRIIRADGSAGWVISRAIPIFNDRGDIVEWFGAASDVTQRKTSEEDLGLREVIMAGQREALESAMADRSVEASLGVLVRTAIAAVGGGVRAGFYLANKEKTALHHVVGMPPEYAKAVDGFTVGPDSLACGLATHTGMAILTSDVRCEPLWQPWLWMAEQFDYRACWSFPIHSTDGQFVGTLAVYSRTPRTATPRDIDFCTLITHTASLIISRDSEMHARRQIERALRESEERHRKTLSLLPAAVYSCDATGKITYFNQQAAQLWGREPRLHDAADRFCGSYQMYLPDGSVLPHDACPMAIALRDGRSYRNAEVCVRKPDGSRVHASVNIDPVFDEHGKIVGAINAFHDVSAFKAAEQARRESERRLAAELASMNRLHELSSQLSHREDIESVLEEVMLAGQKLMNAARCTAQLVEGQPDRLSLRLVGFAGFDHAFAAAFRTVDCSGSSICAMSLQRRKPVLVDDLGASAEFERFASVVLPLGVRSAMSFPLLASDGQMLGVFTAYWEVPHRPDPHELRMLDLFLQQVARQIERRSAEKALRDSETRFRMVADNMAQLAWTCDVLGNITWCNRRWAQYTGLTFEEARGWGWLNALHPAHTERVRASMQRCAESGTSWEETFSLRGVDGNYRWFLSRAVPIYGDSNQITQWFGTNTDVTEWREADEALKDADRRKDEFLATLAHELRNPLAPIRNSLQVLKVGSADPQMVGRVRKMMERQVSHMVRLVDDLMEVSRITRGKIELRREKVDLSTVVRNAVETSKPLFEGAGHQLTVTLPSQPIFLEADPVRLAQVFTNLLNNASKYTEMAGQIWITVSSGESDAAISIRDSGIGIPAEMLGKVFDLFTQVDTAYSRAQGGLGIGLTLARSLVSLHGGSIEAKSDGRNCGSEFVVRLPLPGSLGIAPSDARDCENSMPLASGRILVVDDNRDAAESLAILLQCLGADVRTVGNGSEAIEVLETYRPTTILLDIGMPGIDGLEVARRIRQKDVGREVQLIALTGWGQEEDRRRSRDAGFDHHLVKPLDLSKLQELLR